MAPRGNRGRGTASSTRSKRGKNQAPNPPTNVQEVEVVQSVESDSSTSSSSQDHPAIARDVTPIFLHGRKYFKSEDLATKREGKTKKTSHIWDKEKGFEIILDVTHENKTSAPAKFYYCCLCLDKNKDLTYKPLSVNGISSIHSHFSKKHGLDKDGNKVDHSNSTRNSTATASPGPSNSIIFKHHLVDFKLLLIQWIVFCHIAFMQIENRYFQNLLNFLNSSFAQFLPCRNTFRRWVLAEYHRQKKRLKTELKKTRSNIHLSFDLWTSPNCHAIIAVVAHYIDSKGRRQTKLLAIRQLKGEHSGENIAASVLKVIKVYRIRDRIGFFVLDNIGSNDTAVEHILCSLYPQMSSQARKRRRLRCLLHVTNLVAKAFLLGRKAEDIADELYQAQYHADFKKMARVWHKFGALGRLHNLIRHIRLSPQRRQEFRQCQSDRESWKEFNKLEVKKYSIQLYSILLFINSSS